MNEYEKILHENKCSSIQSIYALVELKSPHDPVGPGDVIQRSRLTSRYAWAVPNDRAINTLVALSPIIEIGAGGGYWGSLVAAAGGDIICFDNEPYKNPWCDTPKWFDVRVGSYEQVRHHSNRTLFLCWPPMSELATNCVKNYSGSYIVYVGESSGGCNAEDEFWQALDKGGFKELEDVRIPQFWGLHDRMIVYRRWR